MQWLIYHKHFEPIIVIVILLRGKHTPGRQYSHLRLHRTLGNAPVL